MVFSKSKYNTENVFVYLGVYHPYRMPDGQSRNPAFNTFSSKILDLKRTDESQKVLQAVNFFYKKVNPLIKVDIPISVVPSHDPAKTNSGLDILVKKIIDNRRIDATDCLIRAQKISKLSKGGNRSKQTHINSIEVKNSYKIRNKNILLIDDICTTKNSLLACRKLLKNTGANSVSCLVLGKTER